MRKKFISGVIPMAALSVFFTVLGAAPSARAQSAMSAPAPSGKIPRVRLRLGVAFPTDSDTKEVVGNNIPSFGVSYDLPINSPFRAMPHSAVFVYVDTAGKDRSRDFRHLDMRYTGFGAGVRLYPAQKEWAEQAKIHFYFGGSVGLYINTYRLRNERGEYTVDENSSTHLGGKGFIGIDIARRFFVEADYALPGVEFSQTIGLSAGLRL